MSSEATTIADAEGGKGLVHSVMIAITIIISIIMISIATNYYYY